MPSRSQVLQSDREQPIANNSTMVSSPWQPRIIAFLCIWRSDVSADLAGTSRIEWPAGIRLIRVPCSGRVDPVFILRSFQQGADGVLVSGCHPGDCRYGRGSFYARRRMMMFQKLLEFVGIDPRRVQTSWISASEGHKWAQAIADITTEIRALGPLSEQEFTDARDSGKHTPGSA